MTEPDLTEIRNEIIVINQRITYTNERIDKLFYFIAGGTLVNLVAVITLLLHVLGK